MSNLVDAYIDNKTQKCINCSCHMIQHHPIRKSKYKLICRITMQTVIKDYVSATEESKKCNAPIWCPIL